MLEALAKLLATVLAAPLVQDEVSCFSARLSLSVLLALPTKLCNVPYRLRNEHDRVLCHSCESAHMHSSSELSLP